MEKDNIKTRLENLNIPEVPPPIQQQLKLAIINSKKSLQISLWLLGIPFLVLFSAMLESFFHLLLPPWSWIKTYDHFWPVWLRVGIFTTTVIVLPSIAALLNLLSIVWFQYDRRQQVLHIAVRLKKANIIIMLIAGTLALLFIGHSIADNITGHD